MREEQHQVTWLRNEWLCVIADCERFCTCGGVYLVADMYKFRSNLVQSVAIWHNAAWIYLLLKLHYTSADEPCKKHIIPWLVELQLLSCSSLDAVFSFLPCKQSTKSTSDVNVKDVKWKLVWELGMPKSPCPLLSSSQALPHWREVGQSCFTERYMRMQYVYLSAVLEFLLISLFKPAIVREASQLE